MNINRGDRFDYLVSMESNDFMMRGEGNGTGGERRFLQALCRKDYRGNINTSLIRTVKGRTIMVQHDGTSPRGRIR